MLYQVHARRSTRRSVRFDPWRSTMIQLAATVETSGYTSTRGIQRVDWTAREQRRGKRKSLRAEQPSRVACSQEGAYEASEKQRRDDVARNRIGCTFVSRAANEPRHKIHLALSFRTGSEFHCLLVYKIPSRSYFTMAAVDMTSIHFYQPPPAVIPSPSPKPSILGSAGEKRNATLQRDWWNKPFKTNREIGSQLQSRMTGETRAGDEGIFETQRHEKSI